MKWADDKLDILQNLEFSIVAVWRANPTMNDYTAQRAYEAAFQLYREELRGHPVTLPTLSGLDAKAFDALREMCEFRLGRGPALETAESPIPVPPTPVAVLVDCLRGLAKSVERHTQSGGRQGYLTFIDRFIK
jgi:hypothetical protein